MITGLYYSPRALTMPACHLLSPEDMEMLIARIREHIECNRIRLADHFKDSDPLRANSITAYRFRQVRCLVLGGTNRPAGADKYCLNTLSYAQKSIVRHDMCHFIDQPEMKYCIAECLQLRYCYEVIRRAVSISDFTFLLLHHIIASALKVACKQMVVNPLATDPSNSH